MLSRGRAIVAPDYLFACLVLGGSALGIWQNMFLQLARVGSCAWAGTTKSGDRLPRTTTHLVIVELVRLAVIARQLEPLPRGVGSKLSPRERNADWFAILGVALPAEPLSLTPAN